MVKDGTYEVLKDIPLDKKGEKVIKKGTMVNRVKGVFSIDGNMLIQSYQEDFEDLIKNESQTGWKYICPVKMKEAFKTNF